MAKAKTYKLVTLCPVCETRIHINERPRRFDIVSCPQCDELFEIVGLSPIELQWAGDSIFKDEDFEDNYEKQVGW
jgi:predicted RNA-binding Zn-ribbon protein involved in translation (DUF1610 family)